VSASRSLPLQDEAASGVCDRLTGLDDANVWWSVGCWPRARADTPAGAADAQQTGTSLQMIEKAYFRFIPTEMSKKLVAMRAKGNDGDQTAVSK